MSDLWTISHGFEELRRQLAVQPHDINDLVFNLAPVVLEGDRQQSAPPTPSSEYSKELGTPMALHLALICAR
jgi:hypothetical protein